jgi:hypothetical protein
MITIDFIIYYSYNSITIYSVRIINSKTLHNIPQPTLYVYILHYIETYQSDFIPYLSKEYFIMII